MGSEWLCKKITFPWAIDSPTTGHTSARPNYQRQTANIPKSARPSPVCAHQQKRRGSRLAQKWRSSRRRADERFHSAANRNTPDGYTWLSTTNKIFVTVTEATCIRILCYDGLQCKIWTTKQVCRTAQSAWFVAAFSEDHQGIRSRVSRIGRRTARRYESVERAGLSAPTHCSAVVNQVKQSWLA
jgi:hypothetical protein